MTEKISRIRFNYKIWMETGNEESVLGDGKWKLLKAIEQEGSLKGAMDKLNLTYRKTWDNLRKIENTLGFPVINPTRGGADGGSTCLTREGRMIVAAFDRFHQKYDAYIQNACREVMEEIIQEFREKD